MDIILDLNSPSKINKIAELAAEMMSRGAKLTLSIQMSDHSVASIMGPYFEWAGVVVSPAPVTSTPDVPVFEPIQTMPIATQAAPALEPVTLASQNAAGLLDSRGTPYNPDLHAALTGRTGGKNDVGEWKMRRGVDRAEYEAWKSRPAPQAAAPASAPVVVTPAGPSPFAASNPFAMPPAPPAFDDPGEAAVMQRATELTMRGILTPTIVTALQAEFECDTNAFLKDPTTRARIWTRLTELENSYAG